MTTGANFIFESHKGAAIFVIEKAIVAFENIFLDALERSRAVRFQFRDARLHIANFFFQRRDLSIVAGFFLGVGFFGFGDLGFKPLGFLHKSEFLVFDAGNNLLRAGDLVGKGREFLVFAGLHLLRLIFIDLITLRCGLDLEGFLFDLDRLGAGFGGIQSGGGIRDEFFLGSDFAGYVFQFFTKRPETLIFILEGEQFFDDVEHACNFERNFFNANQNDFFTPPVVSRWSHYV